LEAKWAWQFAVLEFFEVEHKFAFSVYHVADLVNQVPATVDQPLLLIMQTALFLDNQKLAVIVYFEVALDVVELKLRHLHHALLAHAGSRLHSHRLLSCLLLIRRVLT
jgi:hypothetical protein